MTLPAILLGFIIALLYGALYHLIRGGSFWRLLLYFGLSIVGFLIGQLIGKWRGWVVIPFGSLNFGLSSIGSIVLLILGDWLSRIEADDESKV